MPSGIISKFKIGRRAKARPAPTLSFLMESLFLFIELVVSSSWLELSHMGHMVAPGWKGG